MTHTPRTYRQRGVGGGLGGLLLGNATPRSARHDVSIVSVVLVVARHSRRTNILAVQGKC